MFSKNQIKLITSLQQKKYRQKNGLFVAEGTKVIQEFLDANFELHHLYAIGNAFSTISLDKKTQISVEDLKKISFLTTPNTCLALFKIPIITKTVPTEFLVALDGVRDPGNFGTIVRLCDWFGVETIFCSSETVDCYNPKVVQATMGSLSRVTICYGDLSEFLRNCGLPVFGTFMEGQSVYNSKLPKKGILVLGNEGAGISSEIELLVTQKLSIPRFGTLQKTESLNVASAAAIFLSEFMRINTNEK